MVSCDTGEPVASQYKAERARIQNAEQLSEQNVNPNDELIDQNDEDEDPEVLSSEDEPEVVGDEEEGVEEASPEEIALMLRQEGKKLYEGQCMGCHLDVANSTLNSRDPLGIANQATAEYHVNIQANFPNEDMAKSIVAFLNDPL